MVLKYQKVLVKLIKFFLIAPKQERLAKAYSLFLQVSDDREVILELQIRKWMNDVLYLDVMRIAFDVDVV